MTPRDDDYCPVHGDPTDQPSWPCPIAFEGDPPGMQTCSHFIAMLERAKAEVAAGHYWQIDFGGDEMVSTEYVNHQPTGVVKRRPRRLANDQ